MCSSAVVCTAWLMMPETLCCRLFFVNPGHIVQLRAERVANVFVIGKVWLYTDSAYHRKEVFKQTLSIVSKISFLLCLYLHNALVEILMIDFKSISSKCQHASFNTYCLQNKYYDQLVFDALLFVHELLYSKHLKSWRTPHIVHLRHLNFTHPVTQIYSRTSIRKNCCENILQSQKYMTLLG